MKRVKKGLLAVFAVTVLIFLGACALPDKTADPYRAHRLFVG